MFYAFIVDAGLYAVWQSMLLSEAPSRYRYVPFFGMVAHLLQPLQGKSKGQE